MSANRLLDFALQNYYKKCKYATKSSIFFKKITTVS